MFDQLVQSNSHETAKQGAYMGITTLIYGAILTAVMVWSVFSFDLSGLNKGDLAFSELVTPVTLPENIPPTIVPERLQPKTAAATPDDKRNFDVIKNPVRDINVSTVPPNKVSAEKSDATAVRDKVPFIIGGENRRATIGSDEMPDRLDTSIGVSAIKTPPEQFKEVEPAPIPLSKPADPPIIKKDVTISRGVVNGIAANLPKPVYPPAARQIRAGGEVKIQVLIDELGNVVSATVLSGHPLLRAAAQTAARNAKFTPTLLSKQPVKVNGVIVYNFVPQ